MRSAISFLFCALLFAFALQTATAQTAPAQAGATATAPAKPAPEPKYDKASEVTIKAVVDEVKEIPGGKNPDVHLMVKSGADLLEICLCPGKFLKEMDVAFAKGDQLQITGSKVKRDDQTVILAREIVKGNNTLTLRDEEGGPVWTWLMKDK